MIDSLRWPAILFSTLLLVVAFGRPTTATAQSRTYTLDADFDEGTLVNVNHDAPLNDQLQLIDTGEAFNFIWVAASVRGTIIKIDTQTGTILGEYRSAPEGFGLNPSRTTVDANGSVWAGNRNEGGLNIGVVSGSVIKIGLNENGQCVDRNGNGIIDTSTGLGDIRAWVNATDGVGSADGAPHGAQVQDAADECILIFQRTPDADAVRHVSVDGSNNVWVGGYPFAQRTFHKLHQNTGAFLASFDARTYGCGGYGGLIDGRGILWSASLSQNNLLRYDPSSNTGACISVVGSYGLGIDTNGYVWNSKWTQNSIVKISPAGVVQAGFPKPTSGANNDRGVAVTALDNNIWVANSGGSDVSRLDNNGNFVTTINVGSTPTGVAVDAAGKVWATNYGSDNVMRIDPATNLVDLIVPLGAGAGPYNYSDMTGSLLTAPPSAGTWTINYDSGNPGQEWGLVSWTASEPDDSDISVTAASSTDGITFGVAEAVTDGVDLTVADGQYLQVIVSFTRAGGGDTPILFDLTIEANQPPVADANGPYVVDEGGAVVLDASGSVDPEAGILVYEWDLDGDGVFGETGAGAERGDETGVAPTFSAAGLDGPSLVPVSVQVTDDGGLTDEAATSVQVLNVAPVLGPITATLDVVAVNVPVDFSADFTDAGTPDTHESTWNWGDTNGCDSAAGPVAPDECGVTQGAGTGTATGKHAYTTPGVYTVALTVEDDDGGISNEVLYQFVVVYDPDAGFVTGGGWFTSLEGACVDTELCIDVESKATFGFVSKYKKGKSTPDGNTQFQLHDGDMNFHSSSYDWLVIAGPQAKYKGSGTINGSGDYGFLLFASDGQVNGDNSAPDLFRIKIFHKGSDDVIYDNELSEADDADPTTEIEAGSIVIHKGKKAKKMGDEVVSQALMQTVELPTDYALNANYPNPFDTRTTIAYALPEASPVTLTVYDMLGRRVIELINSDSEAGNHNAVFHAQNLPSGVYVYRLETLGGTFTKTMLLLK